jgi:poly(3-hydroxyoctanoate) depolymerase
MTGQGEAALAPDGCQKVVTVDGTHVRITLRGSGAPLLMLNGIGGHTAMWRPLADQLSRTRQLIMFDAPGAGSTRPLPRPLRMPGLARFVIALLDGLKLDRVDVLGYSWGGALAQQVAHDFPKRVGRLILACTVPGMGGKPPALRVAAAMLSPARFTSPEKARVVAGEIYGGDYRRPGRRHESALRAWNDNPPTPKGYSQQLYAITGWTSLPWLHQIRATTLIISGEDDPLAPAFNSRVMAKLIRRSRLHQVAGGGHLWLLDHPEESAGAIESFLSES